MSLLRLFGLVHWFPKWGAGPLGRTQSYHGGGAARLLNKGKTKTKKYDKANLALGFACTAAANEEKPQCVACRKLLAYELL